MNHSSESAPVSSPRGAKPFYGPIIRDRLWMWGHHPESVVDGKHGFPKNATYLDQAEACLSMGIPNNCVVRWCNLPRHPWGGYFEQFRALKRFSFSITDGAAGTVWDKMNLAFDELLPTMPNLTGCFLDDFFAVPQLTQTEDDLVKIADAVHAHGLRLSIVFYSDQDGFRPEYQSRLALCDEISFWFWRGENIAGMADRVRQCRDFIGPDKDLLLGLYMWDFSCGHPISAENMASQLETARGFLADGTVSGLIFHPTFAAGMDLDSVRLSREWIQAHGEGEWGAGI